MASLTFVTHQIVTGLDYPEHRPIALARAAGHHVSVVAMPSPGEATLDGIRVWQEEGLARVTARVVRCQPDAVFIERPGPLVAIAPFVPRCWVRAPELRPRGRNRTIQLACTRHVDLVTFTNPWEQGQWDIPAGRTQALLYPIDLALWSAPVVRDEALWTTRSARVPDGPVITYVANLIERKQHRELITWIAPFLRAHPQARLVCPGKVYDEGLDEAVCAVARSAGVADQVWLPGPLTPRECRDLLAWSDVHVVNSREETQSMSLYEGLATRTATTVFDYPVLTSAFPFLPVHRDAASLGANLERLLTDPRSGERQAEQAWPRLESASFAAHDGAFSDGLATLLSRRGHRLRWARA